MFISKFDLYKPEWLELVFDDRNKAYGAYDLRKHYAGNLVKSMVIAFSGLTILGLSYSVLSKHHQSLPPIVKDAPVIIIPVTLMPRVEPPKPAVHHNVSPPVTPPAATRFVTMVPTAEPQAVNPPTVVQLNTTAIGPETTQGTGTDQNILKTERGTGTGTPAPTVSNEPVGTDGLEVMPEPYGGNAAWAKFLQKNMHYPAQASAEDKQGRVWLSFIIERDGHLSNIKVERGVGYGMDEEALRVLKLAPAWKPGKQNGQPVRVKYNIPINFVIPDSD